MSYPRNASSPPHFLVGYVYQISDGALQTSGVSARVKTGTGSWGAAAGTLDCDTTSGAWTYTPTQAETDATAFSVSLLKAGCSGVGMTVITGRSANAGYVAPDWGQVLNASATVGLSGTTVKAVTDSVAATVWDKTGYKLASDGLAAISAWTVAITGNLTGNVTGSVNSVATTVSANVTQWAGGALPTIPTAGENADAVWDEVMSGHTTAGTYGGRIPRSDSSNVEVKLTGSAHIAADVHELQPAVIEAQHFALGAVDANAVAADAASEIATAVRAELAVELARIDVTVGSRLATSGYTAPPSATTIADTVLSRALTTAEATAGTISLCTMILVLTGKASVTGGVLTVYRTNGTTVHATIPVASDPTAEPIVGIG
jgi:hypothetical protein